VRPAITECTPQELLPTMPPKVAYACVDVSGANVSWWRSSVWSESWSRITPGWTRAVRASGSTSRISRMCLEWSTTTATLQVWPARLVPQPRGRTGAPCSRQAATAATTSSASRGSTTPIGAWR